jgi:hypothetical protein
MTRSDHPPRGPGCQTPPFSSCHERYRDHRPPRPSAQPRSAHLPPGWGPLGRGRRGTRDALLGHTPSPPTNRRRQGSDPRNRPQVRLVAPVELPAAEERERVMWQMRVGVHVERGRRGHRQSRCLDARRRPRNHATCGFLPADGLPVRCARRSEIGSTVHPLDPGSGRDVADRNPARFDHVGFEPLTATGADGRPVGVHRCHLSLRRRAVRAVGWQEPFRQGCRGLDRHGSCSWLAVDHEHVGRLTVDLEDDHAAGVVDVVAVIILAEYESSVSEGVSVERCIGAGLRG